MVEHKVIPLKFPNSRDGDARAVRDAGAEPGARAREEAAAGDALRCGSGGVVERRGEEGFRKTVRVSQGQRRWQDA